jgi:hypothetical protein
MRCRWMGAALLAAAAAAHAGQPQDPTAQPTPSDFGTPSPITDHLAFEGILFWGHIATTGTFNSATGAPGTPFTAESDLGLSNQAHQGRFELMARLEQRNRVRLDFLDLPRHGTAVLDRTIQFGTQTYTGGELLQSEIDWRETDFTYTYSFLRNDRVELGAGLGVHLIQTEASAQSPNSPQRSDYSAAGPFATVALDGSWRFARRWSFNARGQYFHLSVHTGSGGLGIYHADLQYRWKPNFALGAGFEYQLIELQIVHPNTNELNGRINLKINAPELFIRLSL